MTPLERRHHVVASGRPDGQPMVLVNGFGCDQRMWDEVVPALEQRYRVVRYDHLGSGRSDASAYDPVRHASLQGYADDLLAVLRGLDLHDVVVVAHSVACMMAVLAGARDPERFSRLVLVGPSPRYVDDDGYRGGFAPEDVDELLQSLDSNYLGWSATMAPVIVGNPDRPELAQRLENSFCRTDPTIARQFAEVTFRSDNRTDLPAVAVPTLVLQCSDDPLAPESVGRFVAEQVQDGELVVLAATGHCPQLSAPEETVAAITRFLERRG
ncbi:alpha/beta hydrolase [Angustibacter speluncae]